MLASATIAPAPGLRRAFLKAGAIVSAFVLAACDPVAGTDRASGPEIGQLIDPS